VSGYRIWDGDLRIDSYLESGPEPPILLVQAPITVGIQWAVAAPEGWIGQVPTIPGPCCRFGFIRFGIISGLRFALILGIWQMGAMRKRVNSPPYSHIQVRPKS
jgi:hypothetical protein